MQQLCVQQTLQQARAKVHQLAHDEQHTPQLLLSLGFQCPLEKSRAQTTASRRWHLPRDLQRVRKNYHTLLFSVLVLAFFLL